VDERARLLVAALGVTGLLGPSYDPVFRALHLARLLVRSGMAHQGFDLQLARLLELEPGGENTGEHHEA
jgi:hypothetical protein